jgi:hypothetical protein
MKWFSISFILERGELADPELVKIAGTDGILRKLPDVQYIGITKTLIDADHQQVELRFACRESMIKTVMELVEPNNLVFT